MEVKKGDAEWSDDYKCLLYIISRFTYTPKASDREERWLRSLPLLVMVYEAIVQQLLDFDYAPISQNIVQGRQSRHVWLNLSQDARAAVDDLRESGLVLALKTCSHDFQPSTAFQVTKAAAKVLETLPQTQKSHIDAFLSGEQWQEQDLCQNFVVTSTPRRCTLDQQSNRQLMLMETELLKIVFDAKDAKFWLVRGDGQAIVSKVTEVEEISYVSSPFLPSCLLKTQSTPFSSNTHHASACLQGQDTILDQLSVVVELSNVKLLIGEWIPFGPNQIVMLNERLGTLDRYQGGLFTSELDLDPTKTILHVTPGLTKISVVDFDFESFTNFEADIHTPIKKGLVQIKSFGMHLSGEGSIVYGMNVDAVMNKMGDDVNIDHLSRLLVSVDLDSSKIINDLLSPHQRMLLDRLFMEDARSRNKYSLITADSITPNLPAQEYLDKGETENELKQVLGEIFSVHDIGEQDKVWIGQEGMMLVGPRAKEYEPLIMAHLGLLSRELFIRFFFKRTFIFDDTLDKARTFMQSFESSPDALDDMRTTINNCAHDLIVLEEILVLLRASLISIALPSCPADAIGSELYEKLQLKKIHNDIEIRVNDLEKLLRGFRAKLKQVQNQSCNMEKSIIDRNINQVGHNFAAATEAIRVNQAKEEASFDFLLSLFACMMGYELLDRITDGKLLGIDGSALPEMKWANEILVKYFIEVPVVWFIIECASMLAILYMMKWFVHTSAKYVTSMKALSYTLNRKVNIQAIDQFVRSLPTLENRVVHFTETSKIVKVNWSECPRLNCQEFRWMGWGQVLQWLRPIVRWCFLPNIRIHMTYDKASSLLLKLAFKGDSSQDGDILLKRLLLQLESHGCFSETYTPPCIEKSLSIQQHIPRFSWLRRLKPGNAPIHPTQEA